MRTTIDRPRLVWIGIALAGSFALGVRGWAALEWEANFDSDEAIFAIMASDIADGEYVATVYGTEHLGSIESYVAALSFNLFGVGVLQFRAATIFLLAAFIALHAFYVHQTWGTPAALVSLALLATPGFHVLSWTYQPIGAYSAMLLLGTATLVVARRVRTEFRGRGIGLLVLGLLAGLGLWSNQMVLVYLVAAAFPAFLLSPEWARLRGQLGQFVRGRIGLPSPEVAPTLVLGFSVVAVVALFTSGCNPVWQFTRLALIGKGILAFVVLGLAVGLLITSQRRQSLLTGGLLAGVGFLIGYAPLWAAWVTGVQQPNLALIPSCPTGTISRSTLFLEQILPELFGVRPLAHAILAGGGATLATLVVLIASLSALAWFSWQNRRELWSLLSWDPRPVLDGGRAIELALLIFLPVGLSLLSSNTIDIHSIRHLLVTWQAATIAFGVCIVRLPLLTRAAKGALVGLWVFYLATSNIAFATSQWPAKFTRFDQEAVDQLEGYLNSEGLSAVYADYWGAFALAFLTDNQTSFAPFNGLDRIPALSDQARGADRLAVIFPLNRRPAQGMNIKVLNDHLSRENPTSGEGPATEAIRLRLSNMRVESRTSVGNWDVWVLDEG